MWTLKFLSGLASGSMPDALFAKNPGGCSASSRCAWPCLEAQQDPFLRFPFSFAYKKVDSNKGKLPNSLWNLCQGLPASVRERQLNLLHNNCAKSFLHQAGILWWCCVNVQRALELCCDPTVLLMTSTFRPLSLNCWAKSAHVIMHFLKCLLFCSESWCIAWRFMFTNLPIIWGPHIVGIENNPFIDDFPIETSTSFFFGSHIYYQISQLWTRVGHVTWICQFVQKGKMWDPQTTMINHPQLSTGMPYLPCWARLNIMDPILPR